MVIKNAKLLTPEGEFVKLDISFDTHIREIGHIGQPGDIDAEGCYLLPGLIDLHTHGAVGCDSSDGDPDGMRRLSAYYASHGVTSFCATTMTLPEAALTRAVTCIRDFQREEQGARCVGVYLEGPFLAAAKRGAQAPDNLRAPDTGMFHRLDKASGNRVKLVGVAPELPGAMDFIKEAAQVCTVSLAHTAADYDTAMQAYANGATQTTHLFNAMNGLHHRKPGVVGAALDSGAYAELICDGIHIHPSVVRIAFRLFGDKLILISDSMRGAGMPDGKYDLGGQMTTITDGQAPAGGRHYRGLLHPSAPGRAERDLLRHPAGNRRTGCHDSAGKSHRHGRRDRLAGRGQMGGYAAGGFAVPICFYHHQRKG